MDKQKIRFAIESVEFHSRGFNNDSQVRVKSLRINEKKDFARANLLVSTYGVESLIMGQIYNLSGLWTWVNAISSPQC